MYDLFYIIEVSPQWYNVLVRDTHYCIACGNDLETLKRTIYSYVRKYKVEERVFSALKGLSDSGKVAPTTFAHREKDYDSGKHLPYCDVVREVVAQALKDNRQDTPFNRTKKVVKKVITQKVVESPLPLEVGKVVKRITPLKIQRTLTT